MRFFSVLAITLIIGLSTPTTAVAAAPSPIAKISTAGQASNPPSVGAKPAITPSGLTAAQLDTAIAVLKDPKQRAALIATLTAMRAQTGTKSHGTTSAVAPLSFTQDLIEKASRFAQGFGHALQSATNIALLGHWVVFAVTDPWLRQTMLATVWRLAIVLVTALTAEYLATLLLAGARAALARRADDVSPSPAYQDSAIAAAEAGETEKVSSRVSITIWLRRVSRAFGHFLLALVPIALVALIGIAWLASGLAPDREPRLVITAVLEAYLVCRLVLELVRLFIAPDAAALRLIPMSDHRARWLLTWLRRLIVVIAFGVGSVQTGALLGLSPDASRVLLKLVSLVAHLILAIMIVQARRPVAAFIRGDEAVPGVIASLRATIARFWHLLPLFYVIMLWVVRAIGVPHAFGIMLRIVLVAIAIATIARGATFVIGQFIDSVFADSAKWHAAYPALHLRTRTYRTVVRAVAAFLIAIIAVLLTLQFWGLGVLAWLAATPAGQGITSGAITIGGAAFAALVAWELATASLDAHTERLLRHGRPDRAARYRTLLPMLRTSLLVVLLIILALVVLSTLGVNITLLLGGLSIFGLAVGFGSQKLVQDIITGLFLLLEDAMQVGDWVTLGGISGVVERLSVRSIRLRGGDGSLNIIPFSAVTTVTNLSRDFCFAPINVGVAYKEDIDRVFLVMRDEFDKMRGDPNFAPSIIGDLELWGLDQFGASSLDIVGRVRCLAGKQWAVKREYNRRIKIRFDAEGIEIPFAYRRITIDPEEFRAAFNRPAKPEPTS